MTWSCLAHARLPTVLEVPEEISEFGLGHRFVLEEGLLWRPVDWKVLSRGKCTVRNFSLEHRFERELVQEY